MAVVPHVTSRSVNILYGRGRQPTARGPHAARNEFLCCPLSPRGKKIIWMNIMCTFAGGVGAARDKNQLFFGPQW